MVVAYSDNASVMEGGLVQRFVAGGDASASGQAPQSYVASQMLQHVLMKVETHNHPTAISPFPGAATGAGGEIRDEGATGSRLAPQGGSDRFQRLRMGLDGAAGDLWQTGAYRQRLADHDRRAAGRRSVQQRVRASEPARLFPRVRADRHVRRRCGASRLPQAHHGGRWPGQHRCGPDAQDRIPGRQPADPARWPRHAHRPGWQRGQLDGHRHQCDGTRFRFGAARQPRDATPRPGGHQPLPGTGPGQSDSGHPRRRRRRIEQCLS